MPEKDFIVDRPSNALCIRMMIVFSEEAEQKSNEKSFLIDLTAAIFLGENTMQSLVSVSLWVYHL